jgi:tetratricopeptide (TPR) repeat protein
MIAWPQMSSKRATLLLLLLLLPALSASVLAQSGKGKTSTPATARLEELRAKGSEALFNLDYDSARQTFKEMIRLFPDDPTGSQMQASTGWLETLNKSRLLQAAIYTTQSFYTGTENKPDPRVVQDFRDLTRQATQLAKARLQRNPRDPQTLYTLGAIETLKASFAATIERRFIAALRDGSSGVDRHREVIRLDPNFHDAELSIGLYDYIVGTLPWGAKLVASIVGARGSKKRGIETLERVAKEAHWERDDARVLLIGLYKREKRFPEALAMSRELQERYPRNYLFRLETADTLILEAVTERQANRIKEAAALETEAAGVFDLLLRARPASGSPARALDLIHFRYGEALLLLGQPEHAAKEFLAATIVTGADPGLATRAHLRAAQTFDLAGKRNEALTEYRIALSRPNIYDSFEQARRGLKEPYKQTK